MSDDMRTLIERLERLLENVHQYIGARYVPRFIDEPWSDIRGYEALDVVDNGTGTSYIAKKTVPVGTPLTDRNYWFIYGSTNGAILNLQSQIDKLDSFGDLKNKTIAVFGSSNEVDGNSGGLNWVTLMSNMLSGYATIVNKSLNGYPVISQIDNFINDPDRETYDIVIFCCTKNQFNHFSSGAVIGSIWSGSYGQGDLYTKIMSLTSYRTLGQKIYFASCTPYYDNFKTIPMCIFDGIVKKACITGGFKMLDMHSWPDFGDADSHSYMVDNLHFNTTVQPILAHACIKALLKGNEPFANYSCTIKGDAIMTYPAFTFLSGVDRDTQGYVDELTMDSDFNIKMVLHLKNNTGAAIPAGTNILTIDRTNNPWLTRPNSTFSAEQASNFAYPAEIKYRERTYSIENTTQIDAGAVFILTLGNFVSQTEFMYR